MRLIFLDCTFARMNKDYINITNGCVLDLRCAPIECVRIGFVGLGVRAKRAVSRMMHIEGCEIIALCDLVQENIEEAKSIIAQHGAKEPAVFSGNDGWKTLCEMQGIDLVYICTDWASHADIAVYAMQCGKHAATEVPAATTIADCWRLVDTAEATQRH